MAVRPEGRVAWCSTFATFVRLYSQRFDINPANVPLPVREKQNVLTDLLVDVVRSLCTLLGSRCPARSSSILSLMGLRDVVMCWRLRCVGFSLWCRCHSGGALVRCPWSRRSVVRALLHAWGFLVWWAGRPSKGASASVERPSLTIRIMEVICRGSLVVTDLL